MPISRTAAFLNGPCEDLASLTSALQAGVYFSIWSAWVTDHREGCRASLLATMISVLLQTAAYLLRSSAVGFDNMGLLKLVALQGTIFLVAFKALTDDLQGHWGMWLRAVFSWSYAPIKGGLYLYVIHRTVWGLMLLFLAPINRMIVPMAPSEGISPWHTTEALLMQQYLGVHILAGAETLYLLARVGDRKFARSQLWAAIAFFLVAISFMAAVRNNPTSGLTAPDAIDGFFWTFVIAASFAALYYDYWHGEPYHRHEKNGSKAARAVRAESAEAEPASGPASVTKATTPTTPRRGRPRKAVPIVIE